MTGILERATAHFDRLRGQTVEVPEWGADGAPLVVHFDPLTLAQRQNIKRRFGASDARLTAGVVMLYARRADGSPLFEDSTATLESLMTGVAPDVLARVAMRMIGVEALSEAGEG